MFSIFYVLINLFDIIILNYRTSHVRWSSTGSKILKSLHY